MGFKVSMQQTTYIRPTHLALTRLREERQIMGRQEETKEWSMGCKVCNAADDLHPSQPHRAA